MTDDETTDVIAYAQGLWRSWKPDKADLESWGRLFAKMPNPGRVKQALQEHKDSTDWKEPKRAQLLEILRKQVGATAPAAKTVQDGHPGMYVQCVDLKSVPGNSPNADGEPRYKAARAGDGHLGEFKTLYWPTDKDMPPEHVILERMEAYRAEQESLYGGTWQLIRGFNEPVTEGEMIRRRHDLRKSIPLDERRRRRQAREQLDVEYKGTPQYDTPIAKPVRQAVKDFMAHAKPKHQAPPDCPGPIPPVPDDLGQEPF